MLEHHRSGPDLPDGIGDRLAVDVRGAPMHRLEAVTQDAIRALAREDRKLRDEFALGAGIHAAAHRRVFALVVLAHHPEVDVAGLAAGERALHARHEAYRPDIRVELEFAADRN